ncbi:MAG: tRNA uracil 4-sulfurtransferase ThiI [Candidatus Nanoarchaeia archaeon]|jgi:thiamine biosynthesis protein ThiI
MDCIVIHYAEIGLKGTNRPFFERALVNNIKSRTGLAVNREYGRLIMAYDKSKLSALKLIPGIAYYSPAIKAKLDINDIISKTGLLLIKDSFRVSARRSNKGFPLTSPEINKLVGESLFNKGLKVDLHKPKTDLIIEVGEKNAYLYTKKVKGLGGLPLGVTGKLVGLVSGGIDSPVACYEMIRRGCELILVHFYNNHEGVKEKITALATLLAKYQGSIKLYLVPFLETQKEVIMSVPATHRMITYRRLMFLIAGKVLDHEGAKGFVTGDNVAQVASQTLDNLRTIWQAAKENVYAPLIGLDKSDIISIAKRIGTYETSIKPYSDCCSYLIAQHPETRSRLIDVKKIESKMNVNSLVNKAFKNAQIIIIKH